MRLKASRQVAMETILLFAVQKCTSIFVLRNFFSRTSEFFHWSVWQAGHTQTKSQRYSSADMIDLVYCSLLNE
jgi:hypothetical protein